MFQSTPTVLQPAHFAFMRALILGLDPQASWDRYLATPQQSGSQPAWRATIDWLRLEFAAAARRQGRPSLARLALVDPGRIRDRQPSRPSLAEFAQAAGLQDFSHEDQVWAYEERHGRPGGESPESRRERIVRRQLEALRWLERQGPRAPTDGDLLSTWLTPGLAASLARQDLCRVGDLRAWIRERGATWMRPLRSIGPTKAARLLGWLGQHGLADDLLPAPVLPPRRRGSGWARARPVEPGSGVRPLECYHPDPALPGAAEDVRHIVDWLLAVGARSAPATQVTTYGSSRLPGPAPQDLLAGRALTSTQRAYRREAERLMLWCHLVAGRPLTSLDQSDGLRYLDFLRHPGPSRLWCGPRGGQRWSAAWRPFEGPLSSSAQRQARVVLHGFFQWLVRQGRVAGNPWAYVAVLPSPPVLDPGSPPPPTRSETTPRRRPEPPRTASLPAETHDAGGLPGGALERLRPLRAACIRRLYRRPFCRSLIRVSTLSWRALGPWLARPPAWWTPADSALLQRYRSRLQYALGEDAIADAALVFARLPQPVTLRNRGPSVPMSQPLRASSLSQELQRMAGASRLLG